MVFPCGLDAGMAMQTRSVKSAWEFVISVLPLLPSAFWSVSMMMSLRGDASSLLTSNRVSACWDAKVPIASTAMTEAVAMQRFTVFASAFANVSRPAHALSSSETMGESLSLR